MKCSKSPEKQLHPLIIKAVKHYFKQKGIKAAFWITSESIPNKVFRILGR